jgi:hypothetical protein
MQGEEKLYFSNEDSAEDFILLDRVITVRTEVFMVLYGNQELYKF